MVAACLDEEPGVMGQRKSKQAPGTLCAGAAARSSAAATLKLRAAVHVQAALHVQREALQPGVPTALENALDKLGSNAEQQHASPKPKQFCILH